GLVIAVQGLTGVISAFAFGRMDTRGRERLMLALPMALTAFAMALLLWNSKFVVVVFIMAFTGFLNGPLDIALFTLRQRRTDPSWLGRAFAVSMAFNYCGIPIGAALAGVIAARSIESAVLFGAVAALFSGFLAMWMIPSRE